MSSENNLTPLGIKEEDLNLIRNDHIKFDCGPLVYRTIIDWGFALPPGKKIIDHITDLEIEAKIKDKCKLDLKKWIKTKKYESKLSKDSFSDFDITALHDFLPILCYGQIAQTGGQQYNEQLKDPNSVESLLKEIKSFRNDISHEFSEAVKGSHIDKTRDSMKECIKAAGKLYGKHPTEIDRKVKDLDDEFVKILLDTTHFYDKRVKYIAQKISSEVPSNMLERYSPHFSVPLPGSSKKIDTSDIFQCSNLSVTTEDKADKTKDKKTVFPCTQIYKHKLEKFVVVNGGPGSGKTTLLRNMCQNILQTSVHGSTSRYDNIEQFKIPIYLECRNEQQTTNLAKFLRECLKEFGSPEDDIYEAFKKVEGLVFLLDGYDEITNSCRLLVDSIIDFCRDYNASCIVTSRVDAGNNIISELQRNNLNYTKMFIESISELCDKVNFMKSYAGKMDGSINTDNLVKSFEKLTAAARDVFSSPILLALFISLFVQDPDSVSKMKNEQSAYEAVRANFLREMERKLKYVPNAKGRAEDVLNVLGKFCLELFIAKKYFLDQKDYLKLVAECEKINGLGKDVDISILLSCILTPEHSFKYNQDTSYQFMHSTIQEFFAAKYVSENIGELQDDMSSQRQLEERQLPQLLQVLGLDESQSDIKKEMERYGNIVKLLMLETSAKRVLCKYSNTFTLLLKKYYKPKQDVFGYTPTVYHLDLILSSDSNADIISIVSDCLRGWEGYKLKYYRHIKPMIEVKKKLHTGVKIYFDNDEVTNTQLIIELISVLGDDSEIELNLWHSYNNYQPLEEEFYTQLKNAKCKVTEFTACISSGEHYSILARVLRGNPLHFSTLSLTDISSAVLEEHKGFLDLKLKYTVDLPGTGTNPVPGGTVLWIDGIPTDGKENGHKLFRYISPKSKEFFSIDLRNCHLTDNDANDLLKKLHDEKIRTVNGERTEVAVVWVNQDQSRNLQLHLKQSEEERREEERREEERREKERRTLERLEEIRRELERLKELRREEERRVKCVIS